MRHAAEIFQFQKNHELKFICSACGADRGCNCNAPAVEKLAELREKQRIADRKYQAKKRQLKQRRVDIDEMPTEEEADESWQQSIYDSACMLVDERMWQATRQRFFQHLRSKYHEI
jgi:hypothetical protein